MLRLPGAACLSWIWLLALATAGWELHLLCGGGGGGGNGNSGRLLLDLSLGPEWLCALDETRTPRQLRDAVEATSDGLLKTTAAAVKCAGLRRNPLPLHLRLASPTGGLFLSLRLPVYLHGWGSPGRTSHAAALPRLAASPALPHGQRLASLLCFPPPSGQQQVFPKVGEAKTGALLWALMTLTSFPRCTCPNGRPLGEVGERPLDCHLPRVSYPLQLLCRLKRTQRSVLVELGRPSATVMVHITVEDENDNSPQFSEKRYLVQIPEDSPINSQVLQVKATDRDRGNNAQVHYSIVSGNLKGQFYIHSFSGSIDLINPLDYETIREYTLRIKAQDGGRPPQINSSGMVSIQVLDVNDNAPIFVSTPFQATVLENVPIGYSVLHIQAVDADSGDNARLEYKIFELSHLPALASLIQRNTGFPFQINNSTGWITVSTQLDRETTENYHFGVEARDHGVPVMSSSASVSITVLDVNDNSPTFTEKVYQLRLNEDAAVGSSVLTLTAMDKDVNSVVTYQITSGNTRNRFAITSQSGGGLITLALPLDYKQERQYVLTVTASDGTLFDTVQVFINVTDANTHRPIFQSSHYTVSVSEDKPIGTSIVAISATDEDTGENARITYILEDNIPQFRIDPDTGTITTLMELDYEDQASYTLAITAHDNGIPQKSDTTYVEILILDANDNAPHEFDIFVEENSPVGSIVARISAVDPDEGTNAQDKSKCICSINKD
uniref:Cadherin domain-containing protein n=1 Tax=Laticauda laticaudata TaxID=8630 RepID=A0A8C5SAR6_LATLA